jgi:hypothetical protein
MTTTKMVVEYRVATRRKKWMTTKRAMMTKKRQ